MKDFLIKTSFFFLISLLAISAIEYYYSAIPNDYSYKKQQLDKRKNKIETLILGSSMTWRGLDPSYFHEQTYNASFIGQSLKYDLVIFKKYYSEMKHLKRVIICFSYPDLRNTTDQLMQSRIIYYTRYFDYSSSDKWFISGKRGVSLLQEMKAYYVNGKNQIHSDANGFEPTNEREVSDLKGHALVTSRFQTNSSTRENAGNIEALNELIAICRSIHCEVYLISPPVHSSFLRASDAEQWQEVEERGQWYTEHTSSVHYLNFTEDPAFKDDDFYNSNHLNTKGAGKLSKKVDSILSFAR